MNETGAVLLIVGVTAVAVVLWGMARRERRTAAVRQAMQGLQLDYARQLPALREKLPGFHVYRRGSGQRAEHVLHGKRGEFDAFLFDLHLRTGIGAGAETHAETVALVESTRLALPEFMLRPENLVDKIGAAMGQDDIDFTDHPEFSRLLHLSGRDEGAVRKSFTAAVCTFCEQHPTLCVEGSGSRLLCYYNDEILAGDKLGELLQVAVELGTLLKG